MLSLGGSDGSYFLMSPIDAKDVADYLWNNFFGGFSYSRPFGDAILDEIDLNIDGGQTLYWDDLANALADYDKPSNRQYLTASPECFYPNFWMAATLATGHFTNVYVKFYNNPWCQYNIDKISNLLNSWNAWQAVNVTKVFLGLIASPSVGSGYIPPAVLQNDTIMPVSVPSKYGGMMLWSRFEDTESSYSSSIKPYV